MCPRRFCAPRRNLRRPTAFAKSVDHLRGILRIQVRELWWQMPKRLPNWLSAKQSFYATEKLACLSSILLEIRKRLEKGQQSIRALVGRAKKCRSHYASACERALSMGR